MSATPTMAEVITEAIESRLLDLHTALPGRVVSYDSGTQTVEVELQIKRMIKDGNGVLQPETLPNLPNVPVAFPRSSSFFVSFPLAKDDFVFVIFTEMSLDQWRSKAALTVPGDARRLTLTGAVALPCLYPNDGTLTEAHATAMVVGEQEGQKIFIHPSGDVEITDEASGAADDFVAQAGKVLTELEAIVDTYNIHKHPDPLSGQTGVPVDIISDPDSVACSNVKADD
ncbi:MAG: hypothetical protein KAJ19_14205 [Gammaproteobacteria bacterium]|nr:hypothetical protein [Gammaproteobacteria bacterium]